MATVVPSTPSALRRDRAGFGGIVPSAALARGGETLVAALAVEHYPDSVVIPVIILSDAPGVIGWDAATGLAAGDDRGTRYGVEVLRSAGSLGQLACTVRLVPDVPPEATRLELDVDGVVRVSPQRGGGAGVTRQLSGGPWALTVDLRPPRTVADEPDEPDDRRRPGARGSTPARSHGAFIDLVPVGQARLTDGIAVCVFAVERYWDRSVLTVAALGSADDPAGAPLIEGAAIDLWDDRGQRYRATALHGSAADAWSEAAFEVLPPLDCAAERLAIRIRTIPHQAEGSAPHPGPVTLAAALPAA
jgi:hypothetical protein